MLLSRFWSLVLSIVAVVAVATALVTTHLVNEEWERATKEELRRDRLEVEARLKLDARARLDAIARIAVNSDVRSALRRATARREGTEIPEELRNGLTNTLRELNGQLAQMTGEVFIAVDGEGTIVSQQAPGPPPPAGASLSQIPLVRRALDGYVRDDVWVIRDEVYRMAASPVVDGGQFVGAVIHGKRLDDGLAELLSTRLNGATFVFFRGNQTFAGHMPSVQGAPRRDDLGAVLEAVLEEDAETLRGGERTEPRLLAGGSGFAVYSLVTGTARHSNVGYAIARPRRQLGGVWEVVDRVPGQAWSDLPWPALGGGAFGLFLIAMLFVWLEHDRPLGKLRGATDTLTKGDPAERLTLGHFGGRWRKIASHVNDALDRTAESGAPAGRRKPANIDEILGPNEESSSPSFFGFAEGSQGNFELPEVPPAGAQTPAPTSAATPPAKPAGRAGGLPRPPAPGAGGGGKPPGPPKPPPPRPGAAPNAASPPAAPAATPAPRASVGASDEPEDATTIAEPPPAARQALKRTLLGVPPPKDDDDEEEGATTVARVPEELLAKSASGDDEDFHFREVFEQFVATKKQCGEATEGLTFDKFVVTLRKNRDQIIQRHGAKKVRFSVYVKAGKAALKATPIRD